MLCHYHFTKVVLWRMRAEPRPSSSRRGPAEIGANRLQLLRWPILIARTQRFGRVPAGLQWAAQLLAEFVAPTPAASSGPEPRQHAKRHRAAWNVGVRKA
jgi:hypothetical protein